MARLLLVSIALAALVPVRAGTCLHALSVSVPRFMFGFPQFPTASGPHVPIVYKRVCMLDDGAVPFVHRGVRLNALQLASSVRACHATLDRFLCGSGGGASEAVACELAGHIATGVLATLPECASDTSCGHAHALTEIPGFDCEWTAERRNASCATPEAAPAPCARGSTAVYVLTEPFAYVVSVSILAGLIACWVLTTAIYALSGPARTQAHAPGWALYHYKHFANET